MNERQIFKLEDRTGAHGIDSEAPGLYYLTHEKDPGRIAIAAQGIAILNKEQVVKFIEELPEVMKTHFGGKTYA